MLCIFFGGGRGGPKKSQLENDAPEWVLFFLN